MSLQLGDALILGWCSNSGPSSIAEKDIAYKTVPVALDGAWACLNSALPPRESLSGSWWHIWCVHAPLSIWPLLLFCRNILSGFFFFSPPVFDEQWMNFRSIWLNDKVYLWNGAFVYEQTCVGIVGRKVHNTTKVFKTMNLLSSLHPNFSGVTSLKARNLSLTTQ